MRTPEVMRLTLNAAETGHLVLATMHSATCTEALTRICMSFPAEIQGSIRAQLADCLVGVLCQRLDYLSAHNLRVPRCELLLGSSAVKGTIRAGTFSQLGNVIQASGEEGMWSFDRYQRWMEQYRDWVHPGPVPPMPVTNAAQVSGALRGRSPTEPARVPDRSTGTGSDEADLAELTELANKLEQRKT
jgi:twitching motility protein PilT